MQNLWESSRARSDRLPEDTSSGSQDPDPSEKERKEEKKERHLRWRLVTIRFIAFFGGGALGACFGLSDPPVWAMCGLLIMLGTVLIFMDLIRMQIAGSRTIIGLMTRMAELQDLNNRVTLREWELRNSGRERVQ